MDLNGELPSRDALISEIQHGQNRAEEIELARAFATEIKAHIAKQSIPL
jgi:hypothetical protein